MMVTITISGIDEVKRRIQQDTKAAMRAVELSLDKTADLIKKGVQAEMRSVFRNPVSYTLNSLQVTKTQGHNYEARVWFKRPPRMRDHYLLPEVIGGARHLKGFERAMGDMYMIPSSASGKLNQYGFISGGTIVQILSVLKLAEQAAGYMMNITEGSKRRNRKPRDYVLIRPDNKQGLRPGVYERVQTGVGFGAKTKKTLPFGTWQKGMTRGKFSSVIRARGLRPILLQIDKPSYQSRLDFYGVSRIVFDAQFMRIFRGEFARRSRG